MVIKWIKSNILDLIQSVGLVGVAVAAFVAWLQSVPWYLALLGLLAAVVLILFGINQYEIRKERHKKKLTQLSDKEIEDTIRNWLVNDPGYKFQMKDIHDPLFHNDRLFHFEVEDEWGRNISIARPRAKLTRLDLASAIYLAPDHKKQYEALNAIQRKTLVHNLRVEMARSGLVFRGLEGIEPKLERIDFGDSISLDDNLTEFYLKQRLLFMIRSGFLINELIIRGLGL